MQTNTQEVKQMVMDSMDTIRGMRGFRVADVSFFLGTATTATITSALNELVDEGVLFVARRTGRINVYAAR